MLVLVDAILLFLIAFFAHLALWRVRIPKNHTQLLLMIFLGIFLGGVYFIQSLRILGFWDLFQLGLLYLSLVLAYITTYSGIEVESPSLRMILDISDQGNAGLDRAALENVFTDDILVGLRLRDLLKDKMCIQVGDRYRITAKGILLARLFISYRKLLKLGKGG